MASITGGRDAAKAPAAAGGEAGHKPAAAAGDRLRRFGAPALVFAGFFGLYLTTMYRTIDFGDSGELLAAANVLGIPHSSGYPLYCLLTKFFLTVVPVASPAFRANIMSGLFAAGALAVLTATLLRLTRSALASMVGAGALGLSVTFWSQANIAEVHSLQALLLTSFFYCAVRWLETKDPRILVFGSLALGFCFTNHLNTVVVLPATLYLLVFSEAHKNLRPRHYAFAVLAFLAPLLLYLYLPIRSLANPPIDKGNPETWENFRLHLTGYVYRFLMFSTPAETLWSRAFYFFSLVAKQYLLLLGLLAPAYLWLRRAGRPFLYWCGIIVVVNFAWGVNYNIWDIEPYYLTIYIVLALLIGVGTAAVLEWTANAGQRKAVAAAALLLLGVNFAYAFPRNDKRTAIDAKLHGENLLASFEPNAIVLFDTDFNGFPLLYLHYVEGQRPDLTIMHYPPDFWEIDNGPEAAYYPSFAEILRDLKVTDQTVEFRSNEFTKYAMSWLLDHWFGKRPIYSTYPMNAPVRWDEKKYKTVHNGFAMKFYRVGEAPANVLFKPPHQLDPAKPKHLIDQWDELCQEQVRWRYGMNLYTQGEYYFDHKDLENSTAALERALTNESLVENSKILSHLGRNFAVAGQYQRAESYLKRALKADPKNPTSYHFLANLAVLNKDYGQAKEILREGLDVDPEHPEMKALLQQLDSLFPAAVAPAKAPPPKPLGAPQ